MGLAGVAESEAGATPCAPGGFCAGGSGRQEAGGLCWQEGGGPCAMTKAGQIKKEKAIFQTIRMGLQRDGQERDARA